MADPKLTNKFLIMLGDGGDPETFGSPCGAKARSVTFTNNTGEEVLLDCDDPLGEQAALIRWVESQDTKMQISGRVALSSFTMWREWSDGAFEKNIRVAIPEPLASGGGHWALPALLTQLELGAEAKGTVTFSASIEAAGKRSWVDAAA